MACLSLMYFSTLSHKRTIFRKMLLNKNVYWFSLQRLYTIFLILRRIQWNTIINIHRHSCKVSVVHVRLYCNLNYLNRFLKNTQISNFMKICPLEAERFHPDGKKDVTKLIVTFHNFVNTSKICSKCPPVTRVILLAKHFISHMLHNVYYFLQCDM